MSFSKYGIGDKQFELGKGVLLLSTLVIGAKAWNFDLSRTIVLGVPASPYGADALLGMLGLILWVTLVAYFVRVPSKIWNRWSTRIHAVLPNRSARTKS